MSFSRSEKLFTFFVMLSAATICAEYAMTRSPSNALFLTLFSVKGYPWVWLMTVPLNFFTVYLYNRLLPKIGPLRVFWAFALSAIAINTLSGLFCSQWPGLLFFQYAWKDIYVLLMLKQLWSMIHATVAASRAKYLYGCIYGMGTIGAIAGSLIPGFLAVRFGSEKILFFTLPIYLFLLLIYTMAFRRSRLKQNFQNEPIEPLAKSPFSLIRSSPVLIGVLLLVIFMQVSVGLTEYRFNAHLELQILEKDLRTAYCGRLMSIVNCFSLFFQFLGGFLMTRVFGLRGSHFLVPILLCSSTLLSIVFPSFAMLSFSYAFLKAVDFSLFGVIREMLYVPLQLDAKFRAKAVIDVFAYRTSKAIVSLSLLLLQLAVGSALFQITNWISIAIFCFWLGAVGFLFRRREVFAISGKIS